MNVTTLPARAIGLARRHPNVTVFGGTYALIALVAVLLGGLETLVFLAVVLAGMAAFVGFGFGLSKLADRVALPADPYAGMRPDHVELARELAAQRERR